MYTKLVLFISNCHNPDENITILLKKGGDSEDIPCSTIVQDNKNMDFVNKAKVPKKLKID